MNTTLFILLCAAEITFCGLSVSRKFDVGKHKFGRFIANGCELLLFLLMTLFPGIDFSFRFSGLLILLLLRLLISTISAFCLHKNRRNPKKSASKIFSAVMAVFLFIGALVPSYLFRDYQGLSVSGSYQTAMAKAILIDENRTESYENDGSKREVPLYFYYPENADATKKFPVVFFSHGAFGYYQSNTSTYMELASNGYVVVSMEHPYHSLFTTDSDGKMILVSQDFLQDITDLSAGAEPQKMDEISAKIMSLRLADAQSAVDAVKAPSSAKWCYPDDNESVISSVLAMVDTEKIGFMGHSLGGATAVSIAKQRDDIDAVIDIDGTMLGEAQAILEGSCAILEDADYRYSTPVLAFDNQITHEEMVSCMENQIPYVNLTVLNQADAGFSTWIADTGHMNYTDLPLFSPFLAEFLGALTVSDATAGTGSVDAEACIRQMNALTLRFFNAYLKGEGTFQVEEGYHV